MAAASFDDLTREVERDLIREFGGVVPADEVRAYATNAVRRFDDAPVRTFIALLAWKEAREHLRRQYGAATRN